MEEGKLSEEEKAKIENDRLQKIQDEIAASGMSEQEVVQKYRSMRQDIQQFISKIGEMELELGEHELVITTLKPTDPKRVAFRLVGGVLVESTAGEVSRRTPRVTNTTIAHLLSAPLDPSLPRPWHLPPLSPPYRTPPPPSRNTPPTSAAAPTHRYSRKSRRSSRTSPTC